MISRRLVYSASIAATAMSFFTLGVVHTRRSSQDASYAKLEATIRAEVRSQLSKPDRTAALVPAATGGHANPRSGSPDVTPSAASRARMVADIKKELQQEMGLVPVTLLRDRRSSFVELYSYDNLGTTNYGTAGYLGKGYFITVKHAVVAFKDDDRSGSTRKIASVKIVYQGKEIPAKVVDTGDADVEVHRGDWAIIKTRADLDLPALRVDSAFAYDFADPIFRLGNDYSKGIILSTGYVGQHTSNGLVTCLTDGHPGASGGGVLDQRGNLVGIPIGRMQGDYRFSFILPIRAQMLRKLPNYEQPEPIVTVAAASDQQQ
jgi:S1-C subfamily serine protease